MTIFDASHFLRPPGSVVATHAIAAESLHWHCEVVLFTADDGQVMARKARDGEMANGMSVHPAMKGSVVNVEIVDYQR